MEAELVACAGRPLSEFREDATQEVAASGQRCLEVATAVEDYPGRLLSMLIGGPVVEHVRRKLVDDTVAGFKRKVEGS